MYLRKDCVSGSFLVTCTCINDYKERYNNAGCSSFALKYCFALTSSYSTASLRSKYVTSIQLQLKPEKSSHSKSERMKLGITIQ